MDGWRSGHWHSQWRNSHVVSVNVGMRLGTIPGDRPSPELTRRPSDEHDIITGWVQGPVVSLSRVIVRSGDLHKALVEGEVVPDGVLPPLLIFSVVGEVLHDVVIDATKSKLPFWTGPDGHDYQSIVRERRFLVLGFLLIPIVSFASFPGFFRARIVAGRLRFSIARR